jgi:hypothetical protein
MSPHAPPPTYEDARLVLRLYDLRREARMREARNWYVAHFSPDSVADVLEAYAPGTAENANLRMIMGYWDMAASFVLRGVLHEELFLDSAGEMLYVWAKIGAFVPELREKLGAPTLLLNVGKLIEGSVRARERVAEVKARLTKARQAASKA